jgi:hypothetical protein
VKCLASRRATWSNSCENRYLESLRSMLAYSGRHAILLYKQCVTALFCRRSTADTRPNAQYAYILTCEDWDRTGCIAAPETTDAVDLWTVGFADSHLCAARNPVDGPWKTLRVSHRPPTGRWLTTSSTAYQQRSYIFMIREDTRIDRAKPRSDPFVGRALPEASSAERLLFKRLSVRNGSAAVSAPRNANVGLQR